MNFFIGIHFKRLKFSRQAAIVVNARRRSWKVLFFGNDDFAVYSLEKLSEYRKTDDLLSSLEVVTTSNQNAVHRLSNKHSLKVHSWPPNLCFGSYDIGVVVSFGHLIPKKIIQAFPLGVINVHASLLPRWRGASPIIHAIMAGDTQTGISIMRIEPHHFDTGGIILQKSCPIGPDELMPTVYDRLGSLGAHCLIESIIKLPDCLNETVEQCQENVTKAPRISRRNADVNWREMTSLEVYNLYRALYSIYDLRASWRGTTVKLKNIRLGTREGLMKNPGLITWDFSSRTLSVQCKNGTVVIEKMTINGKSQKCVDFYNGYLSKTEPTNWYFD